MGTGRGGKSVVMLALACAGVGMAMATGTAWSGPAHSRHPVLKFDSEQHHVQLTIPTLACPGSNQNCEWLLYVNEPSVPGQPVVGFATGSSGTLTINYPILCGVMQADVLVGPAPWRYKFGHRRRLDTCGAPTSAVAVGGPGTPVTASLPFSDPAGPSTAVAGTNGAQLPFTGFDVQTLLVVGMALLVLGSALLSTVEFRRRIIRQANWWFFGL